VGSQVVSTGSSNSRLINWDNSSIGVSNKSSIWSITSTIASSIGSWGTGGINSSVNSLGSKMVCTGSSNSWLINRDNSSIGVSNKLGVQVERSSIAITNSSIRSRGKERSSSKSRTGSYERGSSKDRSRSCIFSTLNVKMGSSGSSHSWLIKGNNSSIRMSNELGVQIEWTSISVSGSISRSISRVPDSRANKRSS